MNSLVSSTLPQKYSAKILAEADKQLTTLIPQCGMPLYTSIDLRDSGSRLVAVDVNLFPAGFNNLPQTALENGVREMREFLKVKLHQPTGWKIGLIPEAHTNNEGYLINLQVLVKILQDAGGVVKLGWSGLPLPKPWEFKFNGNSLTYFPIGEVTDWSDALILNHDLSGGPLAPLQDYSKPIFPNPDLGWYKRKKSEHFDIAHKVLKNVAMVVPEINPSDFIAAGKVVRDLDFQKKEEVERLIHESGQFLGKLQKENPLEKPFVYMKNDSGTYGLGIWKFSTLEELKGGTKVLQKVFQRGKQGTKVRRVILQEGIRTRFLTEDKAEFEPVVYSVKGQKIGTFFRFGFSDQLPGETNLNRPGAWFEEASRFPDEHSIMRPLYEFVAKLHSVAAALEDCPCG